MAKKRTRKQSNSQLTPLLVIAGGVVLIVAAFWLALRPSSQDPEPTRPVANRGPYPEVERVSLAEAKAGFDAGSVVMVDVRGETEYLAAHIPGAVLISSSEISSRYQELSKDKLLYLYCT